MEKKNTPLWQWLALILFGFLVYTSLTSKSPLDDYHKQLGLAESNANYVEVKSWSWSLEGYHDIAIISHLTLKNNNSFAIKDVLINVKNYSSSGTLLNSKDYTIYDIVPANRIKTFKNINLGFVNSQSKSSSISIIRAYRAN